MKILIMYSTHQPSQGHLERLRALDSRIEISVAEDELTALANIENVNVIFGHRYLRQSLPYAKCLRWVQSTAGGVDRLPLQELAQKYVVLTNCTLASAIIARHAVSLAWSINRNLLCFRDQQREGIWNQSLEWLPTPRRAIVFGTGNIGHAIATLLDKDGLEVIGVKRCIENPIIPPFKKICDSQSWFDELPTIDWCFLALPHNHETKNLFNKQVLFNLPAHSILVNIGRGETIITEDLYQVLMAGHLGGVALDVVDPKPTDPHNKLWKAPRLVITPHIASHCRERGEDIELFCEEQLLRFIQEQPLLNIIQP